MHTYYAHVYTYTCQFICLRHINCRVEEYIVSKKRKEIFKNSAHQCEGVICLRCIPLRMWAHALHSLETRAQAIIGLFQSLLYKYMCT